MILFQSQWTLPVLLKSMYSVFITTILTIPFSWRSFLTDISTDFNGKDAEFFRMVVPGQRYETYKEKEGDFHILFLVHYLCERFIEQCM